MDAEKPIVEKRAKKICFKRGDMSLCIDLNEEQSEILKPLIDEEETEIRESEEVEEKPIAEEPKKEEKKEEESII